MEAAYGTWRSPVTGGVVAADRGWGYAQVTPADGAVYWTEARPLEEGRTAIVRRRRGGAPEEAIPRELDARTRVHEYGGGAFAVHMATLFFCNVADQRIHRLDPGGDPRPITPAGARHADLRVTPDGALVLCVRERGGENDLVAVPAGGGEPRVVASGHDFFAAPRVSPDGARLAWLTWDHPRMPWEGSELWVADLHADGSISGARRVAGGPAEAVLAPEWSPAGVLHYSSDRTGWWNLYRERGEPVAPIEAEVGGPLWFLGESWYGFLGDGRIVLTYSRDAQDHLAVVEDGALRTLDIGVTAILDVTGDGTRALLVAATPTSSPRVLAVDPDSGAVEALSEPLPDQLDPAFVSVPRALEFASAGGAQAHALFFPPHNPDFRAPAGERPPLLVRVHGGPTAHMRPVLNLEIQYFTSRGFAVVEVNYGGSTGYGRAYRERLRGRWGVVDVEDSIAAARALADAGEADATRMAITGGSAGGWTVLCALAFHDVFAAGADYYGICDLVGFDEDTHKFESRYTGWLAGPREGWRERSPIAHADRIRAPVIVLQGLEDLVVPPSQSERIVAALARNGVPHAYLAFPGEQHGFRRSESLRRAIEGELSFYAQVLGFEPADAIERLPITRPPATAGAEAST